ncbi:TetR/AcrR family transcriptional regulator [Hoeflea sp. AS60]|uniref:TetR/AcrR family transcriptional regulator n=1 Tax=Hoeflea sp. AS60 TaxID=3135780 RepID=UPI00316D6E78
MSTAKTYHHGNLKETLITSGLDILREQGLAGLSLRNCAERAGVSHTAPKNHFGNLAGLLTAIAARGYQQLTAHMQRDLSEDASRIERRNAAFQGYVEFALAHPALYELMFSKHKTNSGDPELLAQVTASFVILRDASEGLDWDKSDKPDADLRAQMMLWSLVHGFAQLSVSGKFDKDMMRKLDILDVMPDFQYRS